MSALLECRDLSIAIGGRELVSELNFSAAPGSFSAVLGCNGAGKTLTMHALAGVRAASRGEVLVAGKARAEWPRRELARKLSLLTQTTDDPFPATVLETVLIGRHPHLQLWQWETQQDRDIAQNALSALDLSGFEARELNTLSGGERRRVAVAAVLVQQTDILLLDEPLNHLDPHHQLDLLRLLRQQADSGRAIVATLHDAGLAASFADQALLLFGDGSWLHGPSATVMTEQNFSRLYRTSVREVSWDGGRTFVAY
jgi:iron complex transport system ATP-binding protein